MGATHRPNPGSPPIRGITRGLAYRDRMLSIYTTLPRTAATAIPQSSRRRIPQHHLPAHHQSAASTRRHARGCWPPPAGVRGRAADGQRCRIRPHAAAVCGRTSQHAPRTCNGIARAARQGGHSARTGIVSTCCIGSHNPMRIHSTPPCRSPIVLLRAVLGHGRRKRLFPTPKALTAAW